MVYIANPNNPTGSYLNRDEMARLYTGCLSVMPVTTPPREYVTAMTMTRMEMASRCNVVMTAPSQALAWRASIGRICSQSVRAINRICGSFNTCADAHWWARRRSGTATISGKR